MFTLPSAAIAAARGTLFTLFLTTALLLVGLFRFLRVGPILRPRPAKNGTH